MEDYKKEFIDFMIECNVLTFGDFTTKSGRKTPFFINTGNFTTGNQLARLGDFYAQAIKENFGLDFDILFGPAYKGIPLSVAASMSLHKLYEKQSYYCSNRKELKDHGDSGIFLGHKLKDGDRIVIVEDVTTAGTSIHETMSLLKANAKVEVVGLIVSVNRLEKGLGDLSALDELHKQYYFKTNAIVTMDEVVEYLYMKDVNGIVLIDEAMKEKIDEYYAIYGAE